MNVKQVIVIRRDLKMRRGKECAQAAHASMMWLTKRITEVIRCASEPHLIPPGLELAVGPRRCDCCDRELPGDDGPDGIECERCVSSASAKSVSVRNTRSAAAQHCRRRSARGGGSLLPCGDDGLREA